MRNLILSLALLVSGLVSAQEFEIVKKNEKPASGEVVIAQSEIELPGKRYIVRKSEYLSSEDFQEYEVLNRTALNIILYKSYLYDDIWYLIIDNTTYTLKIK